LKHFYGKQTAKMMENGIFSIKKEDFLYIFPSVFVVEYAQRGKGQEETVSTTGM
jgi:hypothetical protein